MRMLMIVRFPVETFNDAIKDGSIGWRIRESLEQTKPSNAYFTELDGHRAAILEVQVNDPADVPALAEPWFLGFDANVEFKLAMTPDDLQAAGLDEIGRRFNDEDK